MDINLIPPQFQCLLIPDEVKGRFKPHFLKLEKNKRAAAANAALEATFAHDLELWAFNQWIDSSGLSYNQRFELFFSVLIRAGIMEALTN